MTEIVSDGVRELLSLVAICNRLKQERNDARADLVDARARIARYERIEAAQQALDHPESQP